MSSSNKPEPKRNLTYQNAGVDIDAGADFVEKIKPLAHSTMRSGSKADIGGFASLFDLKEAGYTDPIIVAAADGVGTKLMVARDIAQHGTVGIDLVAMCVNDLVVQGAEPLFFLDYMATGRLDTETAISIVDGIAKGCRLAGCTLVGGETAEMPGMYAGHDYDLAGFAVGAVERNRLPQHHTICPGDVVIGLKSTGLHSNGFSLIRRIIDRLDIDYNSPAPFAKEKKLGEILLEPTRIYVQACLEALKRNAIKGFAHITGGGLVENIPRILPKGTSVLLDTKKWQIPCIFSWIEEAGNISRLEMVKTFNCGIGMIAIVAPEDVESTISLFIENGETASQIGIVVENSSRSKVNFNNLSARWND